LTLCISRLIRAGNIYVNVHTEDFPMGEVRGQVDLRANVGLFVRLADEHGRSRTGNLTLLGAAIFLSSSVVGRT
jgi:CHRD domain